MPDGPGPTARALLALEAIQNAPGISARSLGERLGVSERAARRYVAILREAGVPVESLSGPYGGYRIGRRFRLPPLMFSAAEAMGLLMAVLEGDRNASDPAGPVGSALAKIVRVLPERLARPVRAYRDGSGPAPEPGTMVSPQVATELLEACSAARRLRLAYEPGPGRRRVLEEHLSDGWTHPVEVLIEASAGEVPRWIPRSLGRLEADASRPGWTRLAGTTDTPGWYARRLAPIPAPFHVLACDDLRRAVAALGAGLMRAGGSDVGVGAGG